MLEHFLLGFVLMAAMFAVVWAISVKIKNYGLLDVAWSYGVAILAPLFAVFSPGGGIRKWTVAIIGVVWSLRLGTYILMRVIRHHPKEDARYQTLRERWPGPAKFLGFFELQALVATIFALPFLLISYDTAPAIAPVTVAGAMLAVLALCGESLADFQMHTFKVRPESDGQVCQIGLWRYSRHPNYFFESMVWWAFFIAALPSPHGWITIVCPLLMLYFLLAVTGIPLTEEYAVKNKGEVYREYQRTTSAFVPWFHKS